MRLQLELAGIEAAVEVIERSDVVGIAVERILLLVADSLAIGAHEHLLIGLPAEGYLSGLGEVDSRQVRDVILYDGLALELLAVDVERIDLCDIRRVAVRCLDLLFDIGIRDEVRHAVASEPLVDVSRRDILPAVAVRIDVIGDLVVRRLLDDDAVVGDLNRRADLYHVVDLLDVFLMHADAAVGDVMADRIWMIRAVDAVVAADADPAVAERVRRAGRDGCRGIARVRPGRVDFLVDDLVVTRRRRRRDLARADRIEGDLLVVADGGNRAGSEVDDEFICKFYLGRCFSLGSRLLCRSSGRRLGRRRDERLAWLRDERDDFVT